MDVKVYMEPKQGSDDNGVGRVVAAQRERLPEYGITFVDAPGKADLIAAHIASDQPRIDVLHSHGLYWTADAGGAFSEMHTEANRRVIATARRARAITVPSEWVAVPFRRDMRVRPTVIGHGIDIDEWTPGKPAGYLLWNKNRATDVCNPIPAYQLAKQGIDVVTTFLPLRAELPPTCRVIRSLPHDEMKRWIRNAGYYLATTQETFGIGTLEAMACGVPVLGFDWGGTADLVTHKIDGYLVPPGDMAGLVEGLEWLKANRSEASAAARAKAEFYSWDAAMRKYAALYEQLVSDPEGDGVAVVITNHNYGRYVGEAIESVLRQTHPVAEIVVVDDGSTDDSLDRIGRYVDGGPVRLLAQQNQGVAAARNNGIAASRGHFLICLDADDRLAPAYVETCLAALKADRALGLAYTGLGFIGPDGQGGPNVWKAEFDWEAQARPTVPPATTVHCAAMFRRELWERAGGYKQRYAPGEDTEFFTRGLSLGFTAKRVTDAPLFHYRNTPGSASKTRPYIAIDDDKPWMRDNLFPMAAPARMTPAVRSYAQPAVTVIIPVGPGHAAILADALDGVVGQTMRDWECIVVNDSGESIMPTLAAYPFVRYFETEGKRGPGFARNVGIENARAPLVFFLDADDLINPLMLAKAMQAYAAKDAGYVYTGWHFQKSDGETTTDLAPEYDQRTWLQKGQHAVTVLMAAADARRIGGFDTAMGGWEDWDFFVKCAVAGICGVRVPEALFTYRQSQGARSDMPREKRRALLDLMMARYGDFIQGRREMGSCCGGNKRATQAILGVRNLGLEPRGSAPAQEFAAIPAGYTRVQFVGPQRGPVTYYANGHPYTGAAVDRYRFVNARNEDVERLLATGVWRRARVYVPPPPPAPVPVPIDENRTQAKEVAPVTVQSVTASSDVPLTVTADRALVVELEPAPEQQAEPEKEQPKPKRKRTRKAKQQAEASV